MNLKTILILGGNGFSGKHFISYIQGLPESNKFQIVSVDINLPTVLSDKLIKYIKLDLSDKNGLTILLNSIRPTFIVNFSSILRSDNFDIYYKTNVAVAETILEYASHQTGLEKILLIGSAAEYGIPISNPVTETHFLQPLNFYGLSKVFQTQLAQFYGKYRNVPVVVARTFNLAGKGITRDLALGNWNYYISEAPEHSTIKFGNLESIRDYLNIEEAVYYYWQLILYGKPGEVYNVCSGRPVKMRTMLEEMIKETGKNIKIEIDPVLYKADDVPVIYGDNGKLRELLAIKR